MPQQASQTSFPLVNVQWGVTAAYGTFPASIMGIVEQTASLRFSRSDGAVSGTIGVQFIATKDQ